MDLHNAEDSVWAFQRRCTGQDAGAPVSCIFNATPVPRDGYSIGVPDSGEYRKIFDSDAAAFGGSGYNRDSSVASTSAGRHASPFRLTLNLPPLGAVFFLGPC